MLESDDALSLRPNVTSSLHKQCQPQWPTPLAHWHTGMAQICHQTHKKQLTLISPVHHSFPHFLNLCSKNPTKHERWRAGGRMIKSSTAFTKSHSEAWKAGRERLFHYSALRHYEITKQAQMNRARRKPHDSISQSYTAGDLAAYGLRHTSRLLLHRNA